MDDRQQREAAKQFSEYWKEKGYEKDESQSFWLSLLRGCVWCGAPRTVHKFRGTSAS